MKAELAKWLRDSVWPRRTFSGRLAASALRPFAWGYGLGVRLRNWAYDWGLLPIARPGIAVVGVGNLAVGGTGKTPMALWLAQQLRQRGLQVAIISRGYGGLSAGPVIVSRGRGPETDPLHAGDEPVMMARRFDGVVIVARNRAAGVDLAQAVGCNVAVLDDGFQHRALARDFDLVLLSGRQGDLLPAGPMREPYSSLQRAHALALVDKGLSMPPLGPPASAQGKPLYWVRMVPQCWVESDGGYWRERPLRELSGHRVAAVSGLANPSGFYAFLREWEVAVAEVFEFPDHYHYTVGDWHRLNRAAQEFPYVVTTEKDLVKLEQFPFARGKLVALRVAPQVDKAEDLVQRVVASIYTRAVRT